MSLHFIIDGYNLIRHRSYVPPSGAHDPRFSLIQYLRQSRPCGSSKNKVTIVFDGYSNDFTLGDLEFEVIFSCDSSADERIKKMIEKESSPGNLRVVSDDREIRDFSRMSGAICLKIEEFLALSGEKKPLGGKDDPGKQRLSYNAVKAINQELKKLWLEK